jgi:hypothetical protein
MLAGCRSSLEQTVIGADTLMVVFYAPQRDTLLIAEKEYINAFSSLYLAEHISTTQGKCLPEGEMIFWRKGKPKAQVYFSLSCRQYSVKGHTQNTFFQITQEGCEFLALAQQWGGALPLGE